MGEKEGQNRGLKTQELQTGQVGQFEGETMHPQGRLQWRLLGRRSRGGPGPEGREMGTLQGLVVRQREPEAQLCCVPGSCPLAGSFHFLSLSSLTSGTGMLAVCARMLTQSCVTLCHPMDCSPPGSSVQEYWSG